MAVHLWRQRELGEYTFVDGFDFNSRELKPVTLDGAEELRIKTRCLAATSFISHLAFNSVSPSRLSERLNGFDLSHQREVNWLKPWCEWEMSSLGAWTPTN